MSQPSSMMYKNSQNLYLKNLLKYPKREGGGGNIALVKKKTGPALRMLLPLSLISSLPARQSPHQKKSRFKTRFTSCSQNRTSEHAKSSSSLSLYKRTRKVHRGESKIPRGSPHSSTLCSLSLPHTHTWCCRYSLKAFIRKKRTC